MWTELLESCLHAGREPSRGAGVSVPPLTACLSLGIWKAVPLLEQWREDTLAAPSRQQQPQPEWQVG